MGVNLLKRQCNIPNAHKLRNYDTMMALQDMIDSTVMPGGVPYEDYHRSCLSNLKNHVESAHEGKKPFKCNE